MKARTITLLAGLLVAASTQSFAYVKLDNSDPTVKLSISGEITKDDAESVARQTAGIKSAITVLLDSVGGDVDAAIKIGWIIRDIEATTYVLRGAKCLSSCALIYIAGVIRDNDGIIGLHRPYLGAALNRETVERAVPVMLQKVKDYVREMGISDAFFDAMVNTEVSDVRLYRGDEIKKLVSETDPTYDEILISYRAREYGLSAAEMRRRETLADRQCNNVSEIYNRRSRGAIYWGTDVATYERLLDNYLFPECPLPTPEQTSILKATDNRKRLDLPFVIEFQTCRIKAVKRLLKTNAPKAGRPLPLTNQN